MERLRVFFIHWIKPIAIALVLLVAFVFFVGNWFVVSSSSMSNTLLKGDLVFVNKLPFGARLWKNRMPGYTNVKLNDIIAFNYPDLDSVSKTWQKPIWIKRVVGLPGDTVELIKGDSHVNGKDSDMDLIEVIKHNYHVKLKGDEASFFYQNEIKEYNRVSEKNDWLIPLSKLEANALKTHPQVVHIYEVIAKKQKANPEVYPYDPEIGWNEDYYGSLVIPKKGMTIELTKENIPLYRICIEGYEGQELLELDGRFMLNGKEIKQYTFTQNYFFVLGDNRHYSTDSRYWGFLPMANIIGRVSGVFLSVNRDKQKWSEKIRWKRTFSFSN